MTYGHLRPDCLYNGISSGPTLGIEYGKAFTFTFACCYDYRRHFAVGCSPSATSSEPVLYGSRHGEPGERLTTPATTTTTTRRDVDDEVAADWRTLDADFGLSAARRRVVGRLRHDAGWDRTPPALGLTPRSTDRGLQRPIASRSRVDGQYSPRCCCGSVQGAGPHYP